MAVEETIERRLVPGLGEINEVKRGFRIFGHRRSPSIQPAEVTTGGRTFLAARTFDRCEGGPMKFTVALILAAGLSAAACGGGVPPTSPTPAPPAPSNPPAPTPPVPAPVVTGAVWVVVLPEGGGGECITGATVQAIVDGTVVQTKTQQPCDYWDPDYDLFFKDLPVEGVTIRASAPGYLTREVTATPSNGWITAVTISLRRAN
jgi:hypothetical protein